MGVYVILDGVRREYPSAYRWEPAEGGGIVIYANANNNPCFRENPQIIGYLAINVPLAQYGRYDLVGWMEEKGNE